MPSSCGESNVYVIVFYTLLIQPCIVKVCWNQSDEISQRHYVQQPVLLVSIVIKKGLKDITWCQTLTVEWKKKPTASFLLL